MLIAEGTLPKVGPKMAVKVERTSTCLVLFIVTKESNPIAYGLPGVPQQPPFLPLPALNAQQQVYFPQWNQPGPQQSFAAAQQAQQQQQLAQQQQQLAQQQQQNTNFDNLVKTAAPSAGPGESRTVDCQVQEPLNRLDTVYHASNNHALWNATTTYDWNVAVKHVALKSSGTCTDITNWLSSQCWRSRLTWPRGPVRRSSARLQLQLPRPQPYKVRPSKEQPTRVKMLPLLCYSW